MNPRDWLDYDSKSGAFRWKRGSGHKRAGDLAGTVRPHGYVVIRVKRENFYAHRLAWFFSHGRWPSAEIDHINGSRADNRLCNLREATRFQNAANTKGHRRNVSGFKGVTWHVDSRRWMARIRVFGKPLWLGLYDTPEEASAAYLKAAKEHFGEFARAS
jgi:hypothetical protein